MSLYYEGSDLVSRAEQQVGNLKSRIFNSKATWKSSAPQLYALVSEASKWSLVLKEVIERSSLLQDERKLTPSLALLLVHDLLLAKKGIAAPTSHPLKTCVDKHKARLQAEFTKARLRRGCASVEALRAQIESSTFGLVNSQTTARWAHPRWIRINSLKTTLDEQLRTTFVGHQKVETLKEVLETTSRRKSKEVLYVDQHIPDLIALAPGNDISNVSAYRQGLIIFQDKASCFPAYLLDPNAVDGDILDACAAPGNKSTHLAALLRSDAARSRIWACERDIGRATILQRMVDAAGAKEIVSIKAGQDFLKLDPNQKPWSNVGALLLDPSCSGSGIVGRDESLSFSLPNKEATPPEVRRSKKRKRQADTKVTAPVNDADENIPVMETDEVDLAARLKSLSSFQTKLLLHAFQFPAARKVTYSTCSIYDEENEEVVLAALASDIATERGWRIVRREEQVPGLRAWRTRGKIEACGSSLEDRNIISEACIRCTPFTEGGTQGFFVAAFARDSIIGEDIEESWEGFDDGDQ